MQIRRSQLTSMSLTTLLLSGFLALLWIAGGASRGDVLGQAVVRAGAFGILFVVLLAGPRPDFSTVRPILFLFVATLVLPIGQLIPLPTALSPLFSVQSIPEIPENYLSWRTTTSVPGATLNALGSLAIPAAMLLLFVLANKAERRLFLTMLLIFLSASVLFGLVQLSGSRFDNPLVNDVQGSISGNFANRNHFALLVAMGCVLTPVWAFADRDALRWRGPLAAALVLLFLLTILAIGSRSGLLIGALALLMSMALIGRRASHYMRHLPPWLRPAMGFAGFVIVVAFVGLSIVADRVEAIDRLLALSAEDDLRVQAQFTLLEMIWMHLPFGAGVGSFDSMFRLNEPTALLSMQYFNQAHNDYLGIGLDAGLPGLLVLASAVAWWAYATVKIMRAPDSGEVMLARLGAALLLLVFVASATDYPARTPIIMAVVVIAGCWLAHGCWVCRRSTLPQPEPTV